MASSLKMINKQGCFGFTALHAADQPAWECWKAAWPAATQSAHLHATCLLACHVSHSHACLWDDYL